MKGGQSSSDKHKKQQAATVRRPIFREPVIEAASVKNVNRASEKITNVPEQAVKSPNLDFTHFVSLPLAIHRELVEKLEGFQKSVLEEVNMIPAMGIERSIFINPQTFHLTVLMLKLWNKDRVAMATKILKEISLKVMDALENRPVYIRLRGVACMRGSPANAHVVYAPIEEVSGDGRLLRACQVIIDAYVDAGLVLQKDARHSLKLHATLMNSRHRKRKMHTIRNDSFDARDIFKRYGLEDWGEYVIREAHLSQRFVYDKSGYYHCCGSIPFPKSGRLSVDSGSNSQKSKQPAAGRDHRHPPSAVGHHHLPQATGQHRGPPLPPKTTVATSSSTTTRRHRPPRASCHLL
ncbi:activating signal cointegrator 1 complex subunit 1 isoform X2 [Dendrobium catenatum]|uniref:activating signal cointegrator 1 complex subunit 1 isoform X2 n=1 Tax=Dendrobium catenatum TaxID=906689 RepID=UPI0010A015B4|nr:activating signal cointegrator 1 complex subunit 1 isoform X2 [Dendrobium catenatum]